MKFKSIIALVSVTALLFAVGCHNGNGENGGISNGENGEKDGADTKYNFYTNIPQGEYTLNTDSENAANYSYKSGLLGGFALSAAEGAADSSQFSSKNYVFSFVMGTDATLTISDKLGDATVLAKYNALCGDVKTLLDKIENSLSTTLSTSYISLFNQAEAGATVEIDEIAYDCLGIAKSVYTLTDGYYNPAVYYSVQGYGFDGSYAYYYDDFELPDDGNIEKYVTLSSHFGELELKEENGSYYAVKPLQTVEVGGETCSMKIDLGGIGKGYAVDKVNALMDSYGFSYGRFIFGASSIALKKSYSAGNYTLGLIDPRSQFTNFLTTPVSDVCISTSGDYEQYYTIDGVRYCHIIDPTTGKPIQTGIMTATVFGGTAAEDDAITTAIMAMGKDRAIEFINARLSDRRVVFTYDTEAEAQEE